MSEKCCQTEEGVFLLKDDYDMLVKKASNYIDLKDELSIIRNYFANDRVQNVEMDADAFDELCMDIGASKLFHTIYSSMCMEAMSNERRALNKTRAMQWSSFTSCCFLCLRNQTGFRLPFQGLYNRLGYQNKVWHHSDI